MTLPLGSTKNGPSKPGIIAKMEKTCRIRKGQEGNWHADKLER